MDEGGTAKRMGMVEWSVQFLFQKYRPSWTGKEKSNVQVLEILLWIQKVLGLTSGIFRKQKYFYLKIWGSQFCQ